MTLRTKTLFPVALVALAALSPAPIKEPKRNFKPVAERSEAQLLKEMRFNGAYKPVGRVPKKTEEVTPARDRNTTRDSGSVSTASAGIVNRDDGAIARASETVQAEKSGFRAPIWLLLALAAGGAFGIVRGLRAWADKALPAPRR